MKTDLEWKNKWIKEFDKECKMFSSPAEQEFQLCLVAQGYRYKVFYRVLNLFGSEFIAYKYIQNLKEEINSCT